MASKTELRVKSHYYRKNAGYKQNELALLLNVAPSTLSKWENGSAPWPVADLTRYCELLGLDEAQSQALFDLAEAAKAPTTTNIQAPEEAARRSVAPDSTIAMGATTELSTSAAQPDDHNIEVSVSSANSQGRGKRRAIVTVVLVSIVMVVASIFIAIIGPAKGQEDLDLLQKKWIGHTAELAYPDAGGLTIKENDLDNAFGKAESEMITIDVDEYPLLKVNVPKIAAKSSYTIQLHNKRTDEYRDVLEGITLPGEQIVNLPQATDWHGEQSFTINVWISGEGKSVQLTTIRLEPVEKPLLGRLRTIF